MAKFEDALSMVLRHEGGLSMDAQDEGGITNMGISLRFYKKRVKVDADESNIRNLNIAEVSDIYKKFFWDPNRYDEIDNQNLANRMMDLAVNTGSLNANSFLQHAVNLIAPGSALQIDGKIGLKTLAAANNSDQLLLYIHLLIQAAQYYKLIAKNDQNHKFLSGWRNRLIN